VLEITAEVDASIVLFDYARCRGRLICILNGNGAVEQATLCKPIGRIVTLHGRSNILSISRIFLPLPNRQVQEKADSLFIMKLRTND